MLESSFRTANLRERRKGRMRNTFMCRQMHERAISMVHREGATGAAFVPLRADHEVVHDEAAPAVEQVGKSFLAAG